MFLGVVVASQMMTTTLHVHTAVVKSWLSRYHRQPFVITVNNTLFKYGSRKSHVTSKAVFFSRHAVHVIFVHPYVTHQMSNYHQLCWQSVFCNGRPLVEISVHPLRVGSKGNSKNLKGRKSSFNRSSIRNSICQLTSCNDDLCLTPENTRVCTDQGQHLLVRLSARFLCFSPIP